MKESFGAALAFVLRAEGGKTDDRLDRGGRTNCGVTQATFDDWLWSHGKVKRDVWTMTTNECADIYHAMYWSAIRGDDMPAPLDFVLFDTAVQHGPRRAIEMLQQALGVQDDGIVGQLTMQQIARDTNTKGGHDSAKSLAAGVIVERVKFYQHIIAADPSQKRFETGWGNRVAQLCAAAGLQEETKEAETI